MYYWLGREKFVFMTEAAIKCGRCEIALLAVSRTYSHFKPFPAHIRTTSRFLAQFGASRKILHNFKYEKSTIYRETGLSLDTWVEFRQNLGSV